MLCRSLCRGVSKLVCPLLGKSTREGVYSVRRGLIELCQPAFTTVCAASTNARHKASLAPAAVVSPKPTGPISRAKPVRSVQVNNKNRRIEVTWHDGATTQYPYVWLKDNCQCEKCFHPHTKARLLLMRHLDLTVTPSHVQVDENKERLLVTWDDGHISPFPFDWLQPRSFTRQAQQRRQRDFHAETILWDAHMMQDKIPSVDYTMAIKDDYALYEWLTYMEQYGLALLTDAPPEVGHVVKMAERVSFIRRTQYGELYDVITRPDPPNLAYTSTPLGLHTDMPCDVYSAGAQLLHCIKQIKTTGGANEFVDAFNVAMQMKEYHPEYYDILMNVEVDFVDVGQDTYKFHKLTRHPTLRMDNSGGMVRMAYSNQMRDSYLNLPLEKVETFYKALKKFDDLMYDPRNLVLIKLKPGEIICFHNLRVLHGRQGYEPLNSGDRHLHGFFIDWDELHSRRRVLKDELNIRE